MSLNSDDKNRDKNEDENKRTRRIRRTYERNDKPSIRRRMGVTALAIASIATIVVLLSSGAYFVAYAPSIHAEWGNGIINTHGGTSSSHITNNSPQISLYTEQETRNIKSLSENDIQSLQNGTGEAFGGIAKLAELNGYPGPRHVLDMASELQLTDRQRMEIERIYQNMSDKAKSIGAAIIAIEQDIDRGFANKTMTEENIKSILDKSADLYGQLRFVHLSAHLETVQILSIEQVQMYNMMRGYDSSGTESSNITSNNNNSSSHHQY